MTGTWRWLLGSAAALVIGTAAVTSTAGCDGRCDEPPPGSCFAPAGTGHQEACNACGAFYTGCKDGEWVMIPCGVAPARDGGR